MPDVIGAKVERNGLRFNVRDLDTDRLLAEDVPYNLAHALVFHLANPDAPIRANDEALTFALIRARGIAIAE